VERERRHTGASLDGAGANLNADRDRPSDLAPDDDPTDDLSSSD
jgi:hypothetical protein